MTEPKLTPARRRGLTVLATSPDRVFTSNKTTDTRVYWQTADWLVEVGYATQTLGRLLHLTDAGAARAAAEGIIS